MPRDLLDAEVAYWEIVTSYIPDHTPDQKVGPSPEPGDPFALSTFINWLFKQPDEVTFNYTCGTHCLCANYFREQLGKEVHGVDPRFIFFYDGRGIQAYPPEMDRIAFAASHAATGRATYRDAKKAAIRLGYV